MILKISGGNDVTLGRMWTTDWCGKHPGKITICSNKVLNFNDDILVKRFIVVNFPVCFEGREDRLLRDKLRAEVPGIAVRFKRAYRRALARERFIQPSSGLALKAAVQAASNPFLAMARECFVPDAGAVLTKVVAYEAFRQWCIDRDRLELTRATPDNQFHKKLVGVPGFERVIDGGRPLISGRQQYAWAGLRLRRKDE
jgi:putative DNA primase/helicase